MKLTAGRVSRPAEGRVPAVDKAFHILEMLKSEPREYSAGELVSALGLSKATVHRLLLTMMDHGVVQRDELTKRYRLGMVLAEYGHVALEELDVRRVAKPFLRALMEFSGETPCLAVLQGTKLVIIDKKEPPKQVRVSTPVGWRFPATLSAMGKVLLAWLPTQRVDEIIRAEGLLSRASRSILDAVAYRAELSRVRQHGYATEFEEFQDGVNGVTAPVFDFRGTIVAAIGLGGPAFRVTEERLAAFGEKCVSVASEISGKL